MGMLSRLWWRRQSLGAAYWNNWLTELLEAEKAEADAAPLPTARLRELATAFTAYARVDASAVAVRPAALREVAMALRELVAAREARETVRT